MIGETRYETNERTFIMYALAMHGFNQVHAAKWLGLADRTLRYKIREYRQRGISVPNRIAPKTNNRSLPIYSPIAKARAGG